MFNYDFESMLRLFTHSQSAALLCEGNWGIEREAQRVTASGDLALTDHPAVFGDKLTNPRITTDFAESQLELITPPKDSIDKAYAALEQIHDEVESVLHNEWLWPLSMPPRLPSEKLIRIAAFNDSNEGREKEAYRRDLAERYGKKMQMISGLHVNYSFSDDLVAFLADQLGLSQNLREAKDELYLALTRNFLRYRWLLIYLFGASPTVDETFDPVINEELAVVESCCPACCGLSRSFENYATSLRVSRYGYSNHLRKPYMISFNSLQEYTESIKKLLGVTIKKESELYSSIRLKPDPNEAGASPLRILEKHGIHYVEVRILDLNPFERAGIEPNQLRFLHLFLLFCLFELSEPITVEECARINENHHMVSLFGRKPGLKLLLSDGKKVALRAWGEQIMQKLFKLVEVIERAGVKGYREALVDAEAKLSQEKLLPSSRIVNEMVELGESYLAFGTRYAKHNRKLQASGRAN